MLSVVSVHHSVQGVPITHETFDLTAHVSLPALIPPTSDMGPPSLTSPGQTWDPHPLLVTSGAHHWGPVQTCSLEDPTLTSTDIW